MGNGQTLFRVVCATYYQGVKAWHDDLRHFFDAQASLAPTRHPGSTPVSP